MGRAVTFLRGKHYALLSVEANADDLEDAIKALKNLGFNVTMDVKFED
jgi:shikimate 5-dehydrogenase